jgi:hypothetical protein
MLHVVSLSNIPMISKQHRSSQIGVIEAPLQDVVNAAALPYA